VLDCVRDDNLLGGRGDDIFMLDANEGGTDTVFGLQYWDTLLFKNFGYTNAVIALSNFSQSGSDVIFTSTTLTGFDAEMFTFA